MVLRPGGGCGGSLPNMRDAQTLGRAEVDAIRGPLMLEFGAAWCGICRSAEPLVTEAARQYADVRRIKIEDGPGEALGRSFGVKLWPTLVFLRDGREVARVVRPRSVEEIASALRLLLADVESVVPELVNPGAHPGAPRGFGGGRYAAPYSGSYGGEFRTDYRGTRSNDK
jgi:thioredoxin 1